MAAPTCPAEVMASLIHDDLLSFPASAGSVAATADCADPAGARDLELEARHWLPPLRLPSSGRGESGGGLDVAATEAPQPPPSAGSTSPDAFLSLASPDSGLFNPYASWSPVRASSEAASSGRYSEFATAREYSNYWWDEQFAAYQSEACFSHFLGEDKFILPIDADQGPGKQENSNFEFVNHKNEQTELGGSCEDFAEIFTSPFPLSSYNQRLTRKSSWGSSSTIYGRYQILDDQTERLDDCELEDFQLNRMDAKTEADTLEAALLQNHGKIEDKESLVPGLVEKEAQMLNTSELDTDPPGGRIMEEDSYEGKIFVVNMTENGKLQKEQCNIQMFAEGNSNGGVIGSSILENSRTTTEVDKEHKTEDKVKLYNHQEELEIFSLKIIHRKNKTGFEENRDFPIILNSVVAGRYCITDNLGSATFSKVVQACDLHTGVDVCLKIIKNNKDFFDQSLDEIKLLKLVNKHDPADEHHLLRLYDYFYHQEHLFIVTELLQANLYELQKYNSESGCEEYYTLPRIQSIARQCLEALEYLHSLGIIHCDLKPENILIKSYSKCEIKVIDLGSSCFETDGVCLYVQSRSYRAPEVILGLPYDHKIDIWSLGCILAELYTGDVLFPNDSIPMMLARIIGILGSIDIEMLVLGAETNKYFTDDYDLYHVNEEMDRVEYLMPEKSSLKHHLQASDGGFVDFISYLLQINPRRRPTANEALQHPWLSFSYH